MICEKTGYIKFEKIPDLICPPPPPQTIPPTPPRAPKSMWRLPRNIPVELDTTELVSRYAYTNADLDIAWQYSVTRIKQDGSGISETLDEACPVSQDVTAPELNYVSWLESAEKLSKGPEDPEDSKDRNWIIRDFGRQSVGGCRPSGGDGDGDDQPSNLSIPAPVPFAARRPVFSPAPTFNPNQSAGGGGGKVTGGRIHLGRVVWSERKDGLIEVELLSYRDGGLRATGKKVTALYI